MRAPTPRTSETAGPVPAAHRPPPVLPGGEGRSREGQRLAQGLKTWDPSKVAISDVLNLNLSFPSVLYREQQQAAVKTQYWPKAALPSTQAGPTSTFCLSSHRCRQRELVFSRYLFYPQPHPWASPVLVPGPPPPTACLSQSTLRSHCSLAKPLWLNPPGFHLPRVPRDNT